jgi:hypothetical protein
MDISKSKAKALLTARARQKQGHQSGTRRQKVGQQQEQGKNMVTNKSRAKA